MFMLIYTMCLTQDVSSCRECSVEAIETIEACRLAEDWVIANINSTVSGIRVPKTKCIIAPMS